MLSKRDNNKLILRLDKGEDLFSSLYEIVKQENIQSCWINGIGLLEEVEIGSYDLEKKEYNRCQLDGTYELTSLMGNLSTKEGMPFLHLHVSLSDHSCKSYGGHLFSAKINVTGEFILNILNIDIVRQYDDDIGLFSLGFNSCG